MKNIKKRLVSAVYNFFDKSSSSGTVILTGSQNLIMQDKSAEELHKLIIRKSDNRKVYSSCKDNIWGADLADMQLIRNMGR